MKTQDMFATLRAFADVAEARRGEELCKFAGIFDCGKNETVTVRVKRILARRKVSVEQQNYPATLRKSLVAIKSGLSASGAKAQAKDLEAALSLCAGSPTGSVDSFVEQITAALVTPQATASSRKKPEQSSDQKLARELADQLTRTVLDLEAFSKVVDRLRETKLVSTPTLGAVANRFLGNTKSYRGRKPAIDDIVNRQKLEARAHARGKALDRIAV